MYTYQMIGVADENGRTYESKFGTYSRADGFVFTENTNVDSNLINRLFHDDLWKLKPDVKEMSLKEIEEALGYKVRITDPEFNDKKELTEKQKRDIDHTVEFFKKFFGVDLDSNKYY